MMINNFQGKANDKKTEVLLKKLTCWSITPHCSAPILIGLGKPMRHRLCVKRTTRLRT